MLTKTTVINNDINGGLQHMHAGEKEGTYLVHEGGCEGDAELCGDNSNTSLLPSVCSIKGSNGVDTLSILACAEKLLPNSVDLINACKEEGDDDMRKQTQAVQNSHCKRRYHLISFHRSNGVRDQR
jgi:hypothetical protein